jgi:3-phosphoshikimate 1-carboxyvinyltransferase
MELVVAPSRVSGRAEAPPSKSYTHRGVLAGALADGRVALRNPLASADPRASARCARLLGAEMDESGERGHGADDRGGADGDWTIRGVGGEPRVPPDVMDCGNSGTTMRLFAGAAALQDGVAVLTGDASLRDRPNGPLLDALTALGAPARSTRGDGRAPLVVEGPLEGGAASIDGSVSSQFVSSLLFAGACTDEGLELGIEGALKSRPYVDVTVEVMEAFGVDVEETEDGGYVVPGGQTYRADVYQVPGDFSSASYPLAAGALAAGDGAAVEVANLYPSAQGDEAILDVLERMGAPVTWDRETGVARVERGALEGIRFDAGDTPDLVPTVAVLGCVAEGETRIVGAAHLRHKETDRIEAMATELSTMGAAVEEREDGLRVDGDASALRGADVDGRHDHRVVMALALAGLVADGPTSIATAESVAISYPGFAEAMRGLGADVETRE